MTDLTCLMKTCASTSISLVAVAATSMRLKSFVQAVGITANETTAKEKTRKV
jgi:hypothetical protein